MDNYMNVSTAQILVFQFVLTDSLRMPACLPSFEGTLPKYDESVLKPTAEVDLMPLHALVDVKSFALIDAHYVSFEQRQGRRCRTSYLSRFVFGRRECMSSVNQDAMVIYRDALRDLCFQYMWKVEGKKGALNPACEFTQDQHIVCLEASKPKALYDRYGRAKVVPSERKNDIQTKEPPKLLGAQYYLGYCDEKISIEKIP